MQRSEHALSRRGFLRGAAAVGAATAFGVHGPAARAAASRRVAVLGGGMSGLAVAHELIERGFEVTVFERKALGGKARSIGVPGTAAGGRLELPGEHGFRFFPGFYRNIPDTMRRIPVAGNGRGAFDNLIAAEGGAFLRHGDDIAIPDLKKPRDWSPARVTEMLRSLTRLTGEIRWEEAEFFLRRLVVFMSSCDERKRGQWEYTSWMKFVAADRWSENYRKILVDLLTSSLVAAKADKASAMTIGTMAQAFLYNILGRGASGPPDRLLNAPTNEAWIDPWVAELRRLGVRFELDQEVTKLELGGGRIQRVQLRDVRSGARRDVEADHYVLAVPVERAVPLLEGDIMGADPRLDRLGELVTDWMNGVQFFLDRPLPISRGHQIYMDSDWALTAISQAQFWKRGFASRYGDGSVHDILSIDVSDWTRASARTGQPAWSHTREEVLAETWAQVKDHLNDGGRTPELTDDMLKVAFLDPAISYPGTTHPGGRIAENDEPLLINTTGSWDIRPEPATEIPNLFLAGDYVRCDVNLATMEGANETGRRAVNAILDATGSQADGVKVYELHRPREWDGLKRIDRDRYRRGQRNLFDTLPGVGARPYAAEPIEDELRQVLARRW